MTRGPRRLKDDPDFKWETGCDVADESRLVGEYDLQGTRSRLLAAIALANPVAGDLPQETITTTVGDGVPAIRPGASSAGWGALKPLAVAVTGAFVVAASYWVGVQVGSDNAAIEVAPVESPAEAPSVESSGTSGPSASRAAPLTELVVSNVEPAPAVNVSRSKPARASKPAPVEIVPVPALPSELVAAHHAAAAVEQLGTAESPDVVSAPEPGSTLGLENQAVRAAEDALFEGDHELALQRFDAYLARFPKGKYLPEVQLGRLQALFAAGNVAATEALARSIQDLPALSGRRAEILQLRAESLVLLDRCEDALLVAGEIPSKAAAEVRRVCRRSGKESP